MIIRLPYRAFPHVTLAPTLVPQGAARIRYRPVIPVRVHAPQAASGPVTIGDAFADPGSDFTILRAAFATILGLPSFVHQMNHRWQGRDYPVRFAPVRLEVSEARRGFIWPTVVGFTDAPIPYGCLLGISGFCEFLNVRFCGSRRELEIEPNDLFANTGGIELP